MNKKVAGRECRFVQHLRYLKGYRKDTHLIKEIIHYEDGTTEPNLRIIENYKRPFWVTKPFARKHKDKKEREKEGNLQKFMSEQSFLPNNIATRLGMSGYKKNVYRDVAKSPYLYGADIPSTSLIKKQYMEKYSNFNTGYSVCTLDIEMEIATDEITVITIAMKDKIYTAVLNKFLNNDKDKKKLNKEQKISVLLDSFEKNIPDVHGDKDKTPTVKKDIKERVIEIFDDELDLIVNTFKTVHKWKPDFLAIWNMNFDIKHIMKRLDAYNVRYVDVFCDPDLPDNLKHYNYKEGSKIKKMSSGNTISLDFSEMWHTAECSASFYIIDAMCAYRQIRQGRPTVPTGYGLDSILNTELKLNKLHFKDLDCPFEEGSKEWHIWMSDNKPFEYVTYNQWDSLGMIELELKTADLSFSLPSLVGTTDLDKTKSGPRQIVDELHFYLLERGYVIGTRDPNVEKNKILGLGDWINNK